MNKQTANPEKVAEYHVALGALYKDIEAIKRDDRNPHFKNSFISLPKLLNELKPIFHKHNFVLTQPVTVANSQQGVRNMIVSRIIHTPTGFSEESSLVLPDITDMQKLGASVTYGRRFTLVSLTALEELDDDGETAVGRGKSVSKKDAF